MPNFDNSAMDGYAVVASSCRTGERLRVIGEQPAGVDRGIRISPGEAARIFTGAPMPAGADAVVMQEDVTRDGDEIVLNVDVEAGDFVRRRGCDLSEGQKILSKGERIRAATLALLASQGFSEVTIGGEVDVAIISTGDELVKPGTKIKQGQIYESNSVLLQSLLQRCNATVRSVETCPDDQHSLTEALKRGIRYHVLIISGGVSVGEHDIVKSTLLSLGAKIDIWRVAIKPGKPFLFWSGRQLRHLWPARQSGFDLRYVSAICAAGGFENDGAHPDRDLLRRGAGGMLTVDLTNDGDRPHYIRGKLEDGKFAPVGRQESHALFGLSQSNALLTGRTWGVV